MDYCGNRKIKNVKDAESYLLNYYDAESLDTFLTDVFAKWLYKWRNLEEIAADVNEKIAMVYEGLIIKCTKTHINILHTAIECVIMNSLHDNIMQLIYYQYREEDLFFFHKCKLLFKCEITADQFGAPEDYAIPLTAAVVELASLDSHNSPVEKINCLCTTYDLVFAELKSALAEIISRSSDKDHYIPIIENSHIVPVLMIVIVRAKLIHLNSNMYYIENFSWKLKESEHFLNIISVFKSAIEKLETLTEENLLPGCKKICKDMNLSKLMEMMGHLEMSHNVSNDGDMTLIELHNRRVSDLINESTRLNSS